MVKVIFWAILIVFPFGQLLKIGFINLFDVLVLTLAIITLFKKPQYPEWYKYFLNFLLFCVFGLILNYSLLTLNSSLYLVRLWSYSMIAVYITNYLKNKIDITKSLMAVTFYSALFGFIQYFIYPDTRAFFEFGWDDHYLRMIGTFLDPTFLGLILVLGLILSIDYKKNILSIFLSSAILLTYSRVSILLALLILIWKKKIFVILFLIFVFLFIPKNIGEGTTITRTASGVNKLQNYTESLEIIKNSPIYGIGFNNLCKLKAGNYNSHSCSGLDSSILFLLATTGVIGTMMLLYAISHMPYGLVLKASFIVVFIHSLFSNSLFYPHIMFWLFSLIGLEGKINSQRS